MNRFWFELTYTMRMIRRNLNQSAMCVLMIGLGLAMSLMVFSLLYNTQYKTYDFDNAGSWSTVTMTHTESGIPRNTDAVPRYVYLQLLASLNSFYEMGAMRGTSESTLDSDAGSAFATTIVASSAITPALLQLTGIDPFMGRGFVEGGNNLMEQSAVILSYPAWQMFYAGRDDVIGEVISIDHQLRSIVGIMPEGARLPFHFDFLLPLEIDPAADPLSKSNNVTAFGLIADSDSVASASVEASAVYERLQLQYPDVYSADYEMSVSPLRGGIADTSDFGIGSILRVFAVIILALACLNVGNLLLSRSIERRQEFAIRTALGSSPWQVMSQSMLESFLLCFAGAVLGLLLANIGGGIFSQMADAMTINGSSITRNWIDPTVNSSSLIVASVITVFIWLLSSSIPAVAIMHSKEGKVEQALRGGGPGLTDGGKFRTTKILVGFEIVSSVFLLILCGGLVGSMNGLASFDYGFTTQNQTTTKVRLPQADYSTAIRRQRYIENLQRELEAEASIEAVTYVSALPFKVPLISYTFEDSDPNSSADIITQFDLGISNDFFVNLDIALLEGRAFSGEDNATSEKVVILDGLLAQRLWPNQSALGKRIQLGTGDQAVSVAVVGVAEHISQANSFLSGDKLGTFYRPLSQKSNLEFALIVKQHQAQDSYSNTLRDVASRLDRNVAFFDINSLDSYLEGKSMHFRLFSELFIWIATIAVVLASTGIFAVVSRSALQRVKEMGIRRALGSKNTQVVRVYLRQGSRYLFVGCLLGGGLGLGVTAVLVTAFIDILEFLPLVLTTVLLGMGLLVFAASYLPARKAVAMEPGEALHYE